MNEMSAGKFVCPVCDERLDASAPRCFRCTTELAKWWPLEEALRNRPPASSEVSEAGRLTRQLSYSRFVIFLLAGGLLGFAGGNLWQGKPNRSPADDGAASMESSSPAPQVEPPTAETKSESGGPRFVLYTVQPGDSLWRVAASLTGDGHNWRRLWPAYVGLEKQLQRGTDLEIAIAALQESASGSAEEKR